MTISKYTDNLYQSEVYRELERQAVKKGFFKPTEPELVKMAAQEVQQVDDSSSSNDLIQDIARLAFAMRRKGFVAQAEDIEQKLVIFKRAENALYDVIDEKNSDLIDFAHRDGDVNLIPGSGDLGTFETMQSISDKIQAVIRKQPTGKQGMAELAAMINKVGQAGGAPATAPSMGGAPAGGAPAQGGMAASEAAPQPVATTSVAREVPKTKRAILTNVATTLEEFDTNRKAAPSLDSFTFTDLSNTAQQSAYVYFARLAGIQVNPQNVLNWFSVQNVARNEGVLTEGNVPTIGAEALYTKLQNAQSVIPTAQTESLRKIAYSIGKISEFDSTFLNPNNQSTYIFAGGLQIATNNEKAWAACQWLAQQVSTVYIAAFGDNNEVIAKAQDAMRRIPEKLYSDLNAIKIEGKTEDTSTALTKLIRLYKDISDALTKFTKEPTFTWMKEVNSDLVGQILNWGKKMAADVSDQYRSLASADQLQPFNTDTSQLDEALQYWSEQAQSEDVDIAKKGNIVSNRIQQLKEVIDEYRNKPWIELQDALADMGIDAPNKNVFLASLRRIAESAKGRK